MLKTLNSRGYGIIEDHRIVKQAHLPGYILTTDDAKKLLNAQGYNII